MPRPPNNRLQAPGAWQEKRHRQARCGAGGSKGDNCRRKVPGGKGEGSCKDLPSPGHVQQAGRAGYARRALPDANPGCTVPCKCFSSGKEPCSSEIFSFAGRAASFPPPAPSPLVKTLLLPLRDRSVQMPGGARGARLCHCRFTAWMKPLQRCASVSLPAKLQERCSITLAKHSESLACKNVPRYRSSNPPSPCQGKLQYVLSSSIKLLQAGRDAGSTLLADLAQGGVPSPVCSHLFLLPAAP